MTIPNDIARFIIDVRYRKIAEENFLCFEELNKNFIELKSKISEILSSCKDRENPPMEYYELQYKVCAVTDEMYQASILVIVFSAMYLEAFIYDYAATSLGDSYVKAHLEKLDLVSKWLIIPRLINGKHINKESKAYELLKKLSTIRNSLVHFKSTNAFYGEELSEFLKKQEHEISQSTKQAHLAMSEAIKELSKIDEKHPRVIQAMRGYT